MHNNNTQPQTIIQQVPAVQQTESGTTVPQQSSVVLANNSTSTVVKSKSENHILSDIGFTLLGFVLGSVFVTAIKYRR